MKLLELKPSFLKWKDDSHYEQMDTAVGADGIEFLCPVCFRKNGGEAGTHMIICWAPNVPQTTTPKPGRWNLVGSGYDDLTLVNGSSSVLVRGEPGKPDHWHGFVRNGQVTDC
jgi:hypothetical protein